MQKTENVGRTKQHARDDFFRTLTQKVKKGPTTIRLKEKGDISITDVTFWAISQNVVVERVMKDNKHTGEYRLAIRRELPKAA